MIRSYSRLLAAVLLLSGLALSLVASAGSEAGREITLIARDMTFYLAGDPTPNPTLSLAPGEAVRLTLVNRDPGVRHDLAVGALGIFTGPAIGEGSERSVKFRAPAEPGRYEYVCSFHARMMKGALEVR